MKIISRDDYPLVSEIIDDILQEVLNREIPNDYNTIEKKALTILTKKGIKYNLNGMDEVNPIMEENAQLFDAPMEEIESNDETQSFDSHDEYTNYRLDRLEQRLEEQERLLKERDLQLTEMQDLKIKNDIDLLSAKTIEFLLNNENLKYMIKNQDNFKNKLEDFVFDYIKNEDRNEEN